MLFYRWVSGQKVITVQCQVGYYQNYGFDCSETWCCIFTPWHYKCDVPSSKDETVKLWKLPSAEIISRPSEYNPPKCPIQHGNTFLAGHCHPQDSSWKTPMPMLTYVNTSCQADYSRFTGPQQFAIRIVSGRIWTFSKPHSSAFLFLALVGMTFTHMSWMLPKHNAKDSWPPVKIFRLLSKVRNMLETVGMFNISASGEAPSEQTRHSVEYRVNKKHYCVSVLFGPASHRIQH